jgi:hypothetical protein
VGLVPQGPNVTRFECGKIPQLVGLVPLWQLGLLCFGHLWGRLFPHETWADLRESNLSPTPTPNASVKRVSLLRLGYVPHVEDSVIHILWPMNDQAEW